MKLEARKELRGGKMTEKEFILESYFELEKCLIKWMKFWNLTIGNYNKV